MSVSVDASGHTALVDIFIGGTQVKDAFGIVNQIRSFWPRHMFGGDPDDRRRMDPAAAREVLMQLSRSAAAGGTRRG